MKTKYQQEQFSAYERGGQLVLALNSEKILPETAPVRLASAQLEELDYLHTGRSAEPPVFVPIGTERGDLGPSGGVQP